MFVPLTEVPTLPFNVGIVGKDRTGLEIWRGFITLMQSTGEKHRCRLFRDLTVPLEHVDERYDRVPAIRFCSQRHRRPLHRSPIPFLFYRVR